MIKLKRRSGWSTSGLILYVAALVLLGTILIARSLREMRLQKKAENRQHQLTAVCGAMDEVLKSGDVKDTKELHIFVRWPNEKEPAICLAIRKGEITHTIFHDGSVIIRRPGGFAGQTIRKTWKDYPLFWSLTKR